MPLGLAEAVFPIAQRGGSQVAPPSGFRAAEGVRSAWLIGEGPFGRTPTRRTEAQKRGLRYEKAAQEYLACVLGPNFVSSQWIKFWDGRQIRFCQVDGLLHDECGAAIFEIKYSFTPDAYYQLRDLYEPVVRRALLPKRMVLVLVCHSFDPATGFPEPYERIELSSGWRESLTKIGVFQWK